MWPSIGATRRFDHNAGSPKLWQVGCIRGVSLELAFANLGRETFGCGNFRETRALRSVSLATRVAKNCGKCVAFAVRLWNFLLPSFAFETFFFQGRAAKVLGAEIFARRRHYAAFGSQRATPKIVASSLHSRFVLGTRFRQLGPRKFWQRKFMRSMGATQRFACDAGWRGRSRRDIALWIRAFAGPRARMQ